MAEVGLAEGIAALAGLLGVDFVTAAQVWWRFEPRVQKIVDRSLEPVKSRLDDHSGIHNTCAIRLLEQTRRDDDILREQLERLEGRLEGRLEKVDSSLARIYDVLVTQSHGKGGSQC